MPIKDKAKKLEYQRKFYQENKKDQLEKIKARRYAKGVKKRVEKVYQGSDYDRYLLSGVSDSVHSAKIREIVRDGISLDNMVHARSMGSWYSNGICEILDKERIGTPIDPCDIVAIRNLCEVGENGKLIGLRCFDFAKCTRRLFANLNEYDPNGDPVRSIGFVPDVWGIYRCGETDSYHFLLIEVVDTSDISESKNNRICLFADICDDNYHDITVLRVCAKTGCISLYMVLHMAKSEKFETMPSTSVSYDKALNDRVLYKDEEYDYEDYYTEEVERLTRTVYANEKYEFGLKPSNVTTNQDYIGN